MAHNDGDFAAQMLAPHPEGAMQCLYYLASRPDVDGARLGVMGFSWGRTTGTCEDGAIRRQSAAAPWR